ncbi:MAG: hypothetical protein LBL91_03755 [Lachnospiraceae bacterium]|nr:hypothetical protein [Lachnospiraceae bacterium]
MKSLPKGIKITLISLSTVVVVGAIGLSVFLLNDKKENTEKEVSATPTIEPVQKENILEEISFTREQTEDIEQFKTDLYKYIEENTNRFVELKGDNVVEDVFTIAGDINSNAVATTQIVYTLENETIEYKLIVSLNVTEKPVVQETPATQTPKPNTTNSTPKATVKPNNNTNNTNNATPKVTPQNNTSNVTQETDKNEVKLAKNKYWYGKYGTFNKTTGGDFFNTQRKLVFEIKWSWSSKYYGDNTGEVIVGWVRPGSMNSEEGYSALGITNGNSFTLDEWINTYAPSIKPNVNLGDAGWREEKQPDGTTTFKSTLIPIPGYEEVIYTLHIAY